MFYKPTDVHFYRGGHTSVNFYNEKCLERREKHEYKTEQKYQKYIDEVNEKGYSKIEKFFDLNELNKFKL